MHYDLLAKIKNAEQADKGALLTRFSRLDFAISQILVQAGYLRDVQKKNIGKHCFIELKLIKKNGRKTVNGFKIISKPSRHFYVDYRNIKPVMHGYGLAVISTSKGIMSDKDARKNKVGGEYLFEIW